MSEAFGSYRAARAHTYSHWRRAERCTRGATTAMDSWVRGLNFVTVWLRIRIYLKRMEMEIVGEFFWRPAIRLV